jgi:arylsulfatase A-like enzyme/Tfp pilus assembly protein PilF
VRFAAVILACVVVVECRGAQDAATPARTQPTARNLLIITIDTLRADRVGAYGYAAARTPAIDRLARDGVAFSRAYATAPITLTSHASLMTGRYPAGHGARHNGMRLEPSTPTLAGALAGAGFSTGGFVAAFPLDRRFGLIKGFQTYGDRMPRGADGRIANERPGRLVADEAIAWLDRNRTNRFFLWVHLFEPHAPYGDRRDRRPAEARYDDEVAEADAQAGRVVASLGAARDSTLVVIAGDHGESFGEHGEIGHSIFVYDTTLRVPLILSGPGVPRGRTIADPVALVDVAPTAMRLLGAGGFDADGVDLRSTFDGAALAPRNLYAETFAPLLDFGWSPLRSVRAAGLKFIEAPTPELFDTTKDPDEAANIYANDLPRAAALRDEVRRFSGPDVAAASGNDPEARARLQALGYVSGPKAAPGAARPDPKDRRELAALIAQVTSGELEGTALETTLRRILAADPRNPQAHLRLGYALLDTNRCGEAIPHFRAAIAEHLPSADAHLGLAACDATARRFDAAAAALREAERIEPDNPVVAANLGLVLADAGRSSDAIDPLRRALALDPDLHQARFALALALARTGRRTEAAASAEELLRRLPADAPQRAEVERLLATLRH